jgi:hypothetical protein
MGYNLDDLAIVASRRAQRLEVFVRDLPPVLDEF